MKKHSVQSLLLALVFLLLWALAACGEKMPSVNDRYECVFVEDGLSFGVTDETDKTCSLLGFAGGQHAAQATVPERANGYRVTAIAPAAFIACKELETIALSEGVLTIGDNAFYGCTSLREIVLPQGVETVCWNAFYGCESLYRAVLPPSLSVVEHNAFFNCKGLSRVEIEDIASWCAVSFEFYHDEFCSNPLWYAKDLTVGGELLTDLVLPNDVTAIGNSAFCNCKSLKTVDIPNGVTRIGKYAFVNCSSLTGVVLPDSVSEVGERAFFACAALETATLGSGLQTLSAFAFAECGSLRHMEIPANVRQLSQFLFASCFALESVNLPSEIEKIDMGAFRLCKGLHEIRFAGTVEQWRAIDKVTFDPDSIYADLDWNYGWSFSFGINYVVCSDGLTN